MAGNTGRKPAQPCNGLSHRFGRFPHSAMELMIQDAKKPDKRNPPKLTIKYKKIKQNQLLGVELNAEMFTLAATKYIAWRWRNNIQKGNTFSTKEL